MDFLKKVATYVNLTTYPESHFQFKDLFGRVSRCNVVFMGNALCTYSKLEKPLLSISNVNDTRITTNRRREKQGIKTLKCIRPSLCS